MGWLDDITSGAMQFEHGETVHLQRPKQVWSPKANAYIAGGWSDPDEEPIAGAFVASTSTSMLGGATRTQALEAKSLYCPPDADIRKGDRIRQGADIYTIDGIPSTADTSPFTGWEPLREVPRERAEG